MQALLVFLIPSLVLVTACDSDPWPAQGGAVAAGETRSIPQQELRDAATDSPAAQFYEAQGWEAVWTDAAESELRAALEDRAQHGLDRLTFLGDDGVSDAAQEIALTEAALAYASALADGIIDPNDLYEIYTIPRPETDVSAGLANALADGSLRRWLEELAPQDVEYAALSQAYQQYREQSQDAEVPDVASGKLIRPGDSDPRVPHIVRLLRQAGYLDGQDGQQDSATYTARIAAAVEELQIDRGIANDGVVGPATIAALNSGAADRARAAAVALERRRWLERSAPATRIDVNTAATTLVYRREGNVVDRRNVIVGQPDWATPQLQSPIYRLVANPTWTVPRSIEEAELSAVGPAGLRERNMVRRDGWIVQLPGPDNALGLVKFDMSNDYAIYLHDTPAKALFERNLRQLSHGCVRVSDALGFARIIAQDQGVAAQWEEARAGGEISFLRLPDNIPVRLLYHPTFVETSGEVRFLQDVYGWNAAISERLGLGEINSRRFVPEIADLGP